MTRQLFDKVVHRSSPPNSGLTINCLQNSIWPQLIDAMPSRDYLMSDRIILLAVALRPLEMGSIHMQIEASLISERLV